MELQFIFVLSDNALSPYPVPYETPLTVIGGDRNKTSQVGQDLERVVLYTQAES